MPPRTRYVTARDGRFIACTAVGEGPRDLLYVPQAISAMEHIWGHPTVTAFFARLASFGRLILFDRRGSGMSERLEEPARAIPGARFVPLGGRDSLPFVGDSDAVIGEIEEFRTGERADRERDGVLATVLFTDICRSTDAQLGLDVRTGLHTGECEVIGDDVGGLAVHIAARVVAAAHAREALVSGTVRDLVVGSGLRFEDRGEHEMRGVPGPWRLWAVAA